MPEAFAACREAGRRTKNMRHFDVQILGGVVLHRGNIAEMVTGEGKTLVATLPAYLNALEGKGVHVVTVNDYLARRDCEWMLPIYQALGVTAGYIQSDMDPVARRTGLRLRHHLRHQQRVRLRLPARQHEAGPLGRSATIDPYYQQCQKALNFAIIDEVDNILIDEARTPLIISGPAFSDVRRYAKANEIAVQLTELQKKRAGPVLRGQGEGAHLPPDRRGRPQGRGAGRRRELLHGRQHGMAAPDRQRAQGPPPLPEGQAATR